MTKNTTLLTMIQPENRPVETYKTETTLCSQLLSSLIIQSTTVQNWLSKTDQVSTISYSPLLSERITRTVENRSPQDSPVQWVSNGLLLAWSARCLVRMLVLSRVFRNGALPSTSTRSTRGHVVCLDATATGTKTRSTDGAQKSGFHSSQHVPWHSLG